MSSGFQLPGFQQSGFQTAQDTAGITQTLPSLSQAMSGTVAAPVEIPDLPSEVLGRAFLFRAPQLDLGVRGVIRQTLPSLEQSMTCLVTDDELVLLLV